MSWGEANHGIAMMFVILAVFNSRMAGQAGSHFDFRDATAKSKARWIPGDQPFGC
jgi:hypothetical protein